MRRAGRRAARPWAGAHAGSDARRCGRGAGARRRPFPPAPGRQAAAGGNGLDLDGSSYRRPAAREPEPALSAATVPPAGRAAGARGRRRLGFGGSAVGPGAKPECEQPCGAGAGATTTARSGRRACGPRGRCAGRARRPAVGAAPGLAATRAPRPATWPARRRRRDLATGLGGWAWHEAHLRTSVRKPRAGASDRAAKRASRVRTARRCAGRARRPAVRRGDSAGGQGRRRRRRRRQGHRRGRSIGGGEARRWARRLGLVRSPNANKRAEAVRRRDDRAAKRASRVRTARGMLGSSLAPRGMRGERLAGDAGAEASVQGRTAAARVGARARRLTLVQLTCERARKRRAAATTGPRSARRACGRRGGCAGQARRLRWRGGGCQGRSNSSPFATVEN